MNKPETRTFPLPEEAIKLVTEFKKSVEEVNEELARVQAEQQKTFEAIHDKSMAHLQSLWQKIAPSVGLDPSVTFNNPEYQLVYQFADHGFAAIIWTKNKPNTFQQLFGADAPSGSEEDTDPYAGAPDKARLN